MKMVDTNMLLNHYGRCWKGCLPEGIFKRQILKQINAWNQTRDRGILGIGRTD